MFPVPRIRSFAVTVVILAAFVSNAGAQSTDKARLLVPSPYAGPTASGVPLSHQQAMTVVLKLAGDPVAVVRSRMPNKQLPESDRQAIVSDLRAKQQALIPAIEAQGGQVLATMQHAINGIKVRATPDKIASLATLPGVVEVKAVRTYHLDNAQSVPFIGAPLAWQGPPGLHGEHIKVAIIDTGIDYTHANFGGPGTPAAFATAFAHSTQPADPALFGPNAPKVKGGTDLVGDNYNASGTGDQLVPHPDPNPLDCNGHGSHTAGTAAGFGVTSGGATFHGPYDETTPGLSFTIGPGVAPLADIYAVRVFGCSGSTNVVVEAIDWAIQNDMQVISMSLGADFGNEDDADAEVSENAVKSGVVVVAASGNAGTGPYITSSPATGERAISVAAMDSHQSFPGATLTLTPSGSIVALDANGVAFTNGTNLPVVVLPTDATHPGIGGVSLGCDPAQYTAVGVTGKLVVTARGTCARVARAVFGQMAGAAAVAMINNAAGYPPFEGPITEDPDPPVIQFNVTIPFLGVQGAASGLSPDGAALKAATSATLNATTIANPTFRHFASFSSAGPRSGDGHLKPNVAAPGVSVFSTAIGTGNKGLFESGTSMATPHVAGSAALAIQAHPNWDADDVAKAVVNTADATQLVGYSARLGGNGLVQPFPATRTWVTAEAVDGTPSLSFGIAEYTRDFKGEAELILRNHSSTPASFSVSVVKGPGAAHSVLVDSSVLVPAHDSNGLHVRLTVPAATTGDSSAFRQVQGRIVLTPTSGNNGTKLSVPYYLVARARSEVDADVSRDFEGTNTSATVLVNNRSSLVAGTADFYAWGLSGNNRKLGSIGLRAVGVQSFPGILVFAVNTFKPWNNASTLVFDILIDVDGDGVPDYDVEAADLGLFTTGSFNGQVAVAVFNLRTGSGHIDFLATAPTDGNTIELPVLISRLCTAKVPAACLTNANPRFKYVAQSLDLFTGKTDAIATAAAFNAFNSSISTGDFEVLPPGASAAVPLAINPAEFAKTPALGAMVVSLDNQTGQGDQAHLLPVSKGH